MVVVTEYGFDTEIVEWFVKNYRGKYSLKVYGYAPIEYENCIILPEKYHRMDKLGAANAIGYWMYDNRNEEKIIHIDCDVYIKDYKILDMIFKDLDNNDIVTVLKSRNKIKKVVNCFFGMTPKIWQEENEKELITKLLGSWGVDISSAYYTSLVNNNKHKGYGLGPDCKYFKHYTKLNRGIYNFKKWVETGDIDIDIGIWYEKASVKRILEWSEEFNIKVSHMGISLNTCIVEKMVSHIENKSFDLKNHFKNLIEDFEKH